MHFMDRRIRDCSSIAYVLQELKRRSLVQVAMLKKAVKQLVHPSREILHQVSGWTMRAPKKTEAAAPSSLQVLLAGKFYVYQVSESRLKKVNEKHNYNYKADCSYPARLSY